MIETGVAENSPGVSTPISASYSTACAATVFLATEQQIKQGCLSGTNRSGQHESLGTINRHVRVIWHTEYPNKRSKTPIT
jgi:hypothetical protein